MADFSQKNPFLLRKKEAKTQSSGPKKNIVLF